MKVLTAAEMREVDRRTIEMGIPGIVLMENAGHRVVEFLAERFAPLAAQRIVVLCGKGNNGGDGLVVARQLSHALPPARAARGPAGRAGGSEGRRGGELRDAARPAAARFGSEIPAEARLATLVVDALLGTGISGPAAGAMLEGIREINGGFPLAKVVAVDIPSGMPSDSGQPVGECARADYTVTFTAPKLGQVLPPNCDRVGELVVGPIGSPPELYEDVWLSLLEPAMFERTAGAAPARRAQGNLRPRAGGGGIARQDAAPPPWLGWARCARARGW